MQGERVMGKVRRVDAAGPSKHKMIDGVDEKPKSVYEIVTRQMVMEMKEDVAEVKGRVNTLLWVVLGATVVEFVMRLVR